MLNNTILISFAGTDIHRKYQLNLHHHSGKNFKFDIQYTKDWIENTKMFKKYDIFKYAKYFGYFMWKPLLIKHTLDTFDCDSVLYVDSNVNIANWEKFEQYFNNQMNSQGLFVVKHNGYINKDWTKRDTFLLMNADSERFWNAKQLWTSIVGFGRGDKPDELLNDYIQYCSDERCTTELPNQLGQNNLNGYKEHRWEQSVLSILYEQHNFKDYVWDNDFFPFIQKYYPEELNSYKNIINQNPLQCNTKS